MSAARIDAHHHLWGDPGDLSWLQEPGHGPLRRPFDLPDLRPLLRSTGRLGTVLVESGTQRRDELDILLAAAEEYAEILGVVGWVDTRGPVTDVSDQVGLAFAHPLANRWLKGLRIQAQSESADHLTTPAAQAAAEELAARGVLELVLRPEHLPGAADLARRSPSTTLVVDHAAKPTISSGTGPSFDTWRAGMEALADCPSTYVKISGLVTEADWARWTWRDLQPYVATLLELFGPDRLMLGSDWPVCLLAADYAEVFDAAERCLAQLSTAELDQVAGGTAQRVYHLDDPGKGAP